MSLPITLQVFGIPKAQPRPRRAKHGGVYTPTTADDWKEAVQVTFLQNTFDRLVSGPIYLSVMFLLPRPKTLDNEFHGIIPHRHKPDIDNLLKSTMDALTAIQAWNDDTQVMWIRAGKFYHELGGQPGATILIDRFISEEPVNIA